MMCKFCDKVWSSVEAFEKFELCIDECSIVMKDGKCWLYDAKIFGDQIFWNDHVLQINFCPVCGRSLMEGKE